jgi:hypothetical protein
MSISLKRLLSIGALLASAAAWAQPVDLLRNPRAATPSRHAVAATAFDLNADPVARGLTQLQLQLPAGPLAMLNRKNFQSRGSNSGLWLGSANLREDSLVVLTLHNGFLAGTIIVGTETYEIRPGPRSMWSRRWTCRRSRRAGRRSRLLRRRTGRRHRPLPRR